jgi:hypothetical protein
MFEQMEDRMRFSVKNVIMRETYRKSCIFLRFGRWSIIKLWTKAHTHVEKREKK